MTRRRLCFLAFTMLLAFAPFAHAQWTVFDPTNYANAVHEFHQMQQTYTTALETRNQIIAAYNLAYQMSRVPANLAARYKADFAQWTNLSAPNTYGNTSAWINALNIGSPASASAAYTKAIVQVQPYPAGSYFALDSATKAMVANQYASSELAQGTTTNTLSTLGSIRSNSEAFSLKLANLESDTYSTDPNEQTESALLARINAATLLQIHSQQDTNQLLAASIEEQLMAQKQQIDARNRAINQAIYFEQNFPAVAGNVNGGVSGSIHSISLSPSGH
ncbi:hypothetical protein GCM10011507_34310 [Edaphobacter acidisoli]|uniref:Uncharacterized protein n=1 Tax=Edaphobacter acidisoli TaxID=2040573 RepID=A0A916WAG3_9BACT|nr:hypothetical protein [Edaphobacter acidisoli]GGA80201.1 hypothetical protein GCM10011507_34310 [Edaphobacter acidisoli]